MMTESTRRVWVAGLVAAALAGCAGLPWRRDENERIVPLQVSSEIPAARGVAKLSGPGKDGNRTIAVTVEHLARPERLGRNASAYVVWLQPMREEQAPAQNMGVLMLDRDLKGTFRTQTPFRNFDLFVTAEPSPTVTTPSDDRLLTATMSSEQQAMR